MDKHFEMKNSVFPRISEEMRVILEQLREEQ